jgi:plasmid stability protein
MKQLVVRGVDPAVVKALRERAARNGRSAEAEHREILREALLGAPKMSFKEYLLTMPNVGRDEDFQVRDKRPSREVDLGLDDDE